MKILHVCLSAFFIDDRAYQENELVSEHLRQGHEVLVLASTHTHDENGYRSYCEPGEYRTHDGARVIRLPYAKIFPHAIARSLRAHFGVYRIIEDFCPDSILFHGINGWELLTVSKYVSKHPHVILYADTHTDAINSARNFFSKWLLHIGYYRPILHRAIPQIRKILCVSTITADFAREIYGVPDNKLEFYPLGGHPVDDATYARKRLATRLRLGFAEGDIVFMQSGKQSRPKYLREALCAFSKVDDPNFKFLIAGVLMDDIRADVEQLIEADNRIQFLGWRSPEELEDLLCAADVYVQPGRQSSTMQTSMCCHCAVILEDLPSHRVYLCGNGWLLYTPQDIQEIFEQISMGQVDVEDMKSRSIAFARENLDYAHLAERVLS